MPVSKPKGLLTKNTAVNIQNSKETTLDKIEEKLVPKPKKDRRKTKDLATNSTTFTMAPVIREILTEQRLKNAPLMSDSRYLSNLIYRDKFGQDLYNPNEKGNHQLFEIDPKTGEQLH
ncbi:hypothetical protein GPZ88_09930 (plasmid) [Streptococcus ruminicola]|uniref:Uncharacterized protein n=1 Tax=Streptococcus ruminicola TaxID=2686210 RepID=A0A6G8I2M6_9STRE|nr:MULTISPECIES: hypothetical protein [Streptococcus]QGX47338.1 hypothetical protein GPA00_09385 [Streptococcus equinus]QIM47387.1 hypothetical protein GPZ88_09930 [Streptococcus ruminicola]